MLSPRIIHPLHQSPWRSSGAPGSWRGVADKSLNVGSRARLGISRVSACSSRLARFGISLVSACASRLARLGLRVSAHWLVSACSSRHLARLGSLARLGLLVSTSRSSRHLARLGSLARLGLLVSTSRSSRLARLDISLVSACSSRHLARLGLLVSTSRSSRHLARFGLRVSACASRLIGSSRLARFGISLVSACSSRLIGSSRLARLDISLVSASRSSRHLARLGLLVSACASRLIGVMNVMKCLSSGWRVGRHGSHSKQHTPASSFRVVPISLGGRVSVCGESSWWRKH